MKSLLTFGLRFSPPCWTGAASAAELVVPDNVIFERGIEYSNPDGQHLQLNLARPKDVTGPLPVVLCIHGGGFRAGHRDGNNALCLKLAQRGFVAATVSYRLAPKYQFPAAVHDVKAAVRWLRANAAKYQIDPARIGVTGDSAGGHLAQFLGVTAGVKEFEGDGGNADQSSRVACVVNRYGPSDFTKSYAKSVDAAEVLPLFLGRRFANRPSASHPIQPAQLGHAGRRAHAHPARHGGQICRLRTRRVDARPAASLRGGSGIGDV